MMPVYISPSFMSLPQLVFLFDFQELLPSVNFHQPCNINLTFPSTHYPAHYIQDVGSHGSSHAATTGPPCPLEAGSE
ncbi:hypothetical protein VN97_g2510 [Penicillium thymicola]|uniref:Uncharacterized protein n=1 Tax=Penicillium thymicola TaxID=293382 RepID=A0AAI9TNZ9_PENTH|nr:hypothetical protein VN97_g2510 [Penicillium thymicola]